MKKVLSIMLAIALVASFFCINVSATSPSETLVFSQDFEDVENNNTMAAKEGFLQESEDGNHYIALTDETTDPGWIATPFSLADGGIKVTFKAKNTSDTGWSLLFEAYEGDGNGEHKIGYILIPGNYENDVWYDVTILMRGISDSAYTNKTSYVVGAATKADGTVADFPGVGVSALSSNSGTVTDEEGNKTTIPNYYNRCRFLGHANYGSNGAKDGSTGLGWEIDDVKIYQLENDADRHGVYFYQDFDTPENKNWVNFNRINATRPGATDVTYDFFDFSNKGKDGMGCLYYVDTEANHSTSYSIPAEEFICSYGEGTQVVVSFDICKEAPSSPFLIHVGLGGTVANNLVRFGVPANQLRQGVWYRYVAVVGGVDEKGNPNLLFYRKAEDADAFEPLYYVAAGTEIEKLEEGQTTDVERPIYFGNVSLGNSNSNVIRMGIMAGSYTTNVRTGSELELYTNASGKIESKIEGSKYLIDNFKVAKYVDLETVFADGTAKVAVNSNNPADAVAKKAFVATYDADNRLIGADFAESAGTLEELAPALDGAATVKVFAWDENNVPVFEEMDVTTSFVTAE